jgi:hypothetical protein
MAQNPLDIIAEDTADWLFRRVQSFPSDVEPFGQTKLTQAEQLARYQSIQGDPAAWAGIISEHGLEQAIAYWQKMEALNARTQLS